MPILMINYGKMYHKLTIKKKCVLCMQYKCLIMENGREFTSYGANGLAVVVDAERIFYLL